MSVDRILSQLLGSGAATGFAGGLAGGLASGMLTSKSGRKLAKNALKVGGIAAIGGVAYAAYDRYRRSQTSTGSGAAASGPALHGFVPSEGTQAADELGRTLLRAMIAAAQADGRLDARERQAIEARIQALALGEEDRARLRAELHRPVDMQTLASAATTPEIAAEIYTASLLAIDVDTPAERAYLSLLAARLALPEKLVQEIHRELELGGSAEASPAPQRRVA
jgi:uncharacterized membrane protein YebE (DUF533 family)